jgi:hypothetical protein
MNYRVSLLALSFVGCFLLVSVARADSVNNLELSVKSISSCPSSGCFLWDPTASAIGFSLPSSGGTFQLAATLELRAVNNIGLEITSLNLSIPLIVANITCASSIFANCSVASKPNVTKISFSGGTIYPGENFSLNFGCTTGPCDWPASTNVTAYWTTNVPEPGTMALLLMGVGAILVRRRL